MRQIANVAVFYVCSAILLAGQVPAAELADPSLKNAQTRLDVLEEEIQDLESRLNRSMGGAIVILFGAFCALWALNTNRNPWLWFFAGAFFLAAGALAAVLRVLGFAATPCSASALVSASSFLFIRSTFLCRLAISSIRAGRCI